MKIHILDKTEPDRKKQLRAVFTGLQADGTVIMALDINGKECTPVQIEFDSKLDAIAINMETGEEYELSKSQLQSAIDILYTDTGSWRMVCDRELSNPNI